MRQESIVTKILLKLKERWIETIVAGIIAVVITILSFFGGQALALFHRIESHVSNMSETQAVTTAREVLLIDTRAVIPFRCVGSRHQFIAVGGPGLTLHFDETLKAFVPRSMMAIHILEGSKGVFTPHETRLEIHDDLMSIAATRLFGVEDVAGNGNPFVFAVARHGDPGEYTLLVSVYDVLNRQTYTVEREERSGEPSLPLRYSENSKSNDRIRNWLMQEAADVRLTQTHLNAGYGYEISEWARRYPTEFTGQMHVAEFSGRFQGKNPVGCEIENGVVKWTSYFGGPVVAYDRQRKVHFVVFAPPGADGWIRNLVVGREYVWLDQQGDGENVMGFNTKSHFFVKPPTGLDIEAELANGASCNISFHTHLARAYGKRYRSLKQQGAKPEELMRVRQLALIAARKAIESDPSARALLRRLLHPTPDSEDEDDDDLQVFESDKDFKELIDSE